MTYPGNSSLSPDVQQRILSTFEQTLGLATEGSRQEALLGCAFDAADTFWPKEKDIDRGARRVMEKRTRQEAELRKLQKKNAPKQFTFEARDGKIVIEKGDKRIEIG